MNELQTALRPTTFLKPGKLIEQTGIEITVVSEAFQHTGSFKFRAAYNVALNVPNSRLITASSGNFGQALACAAKLTGKDCIVVMPDTSAKVKVDAVRGYGAVVDMISVAEIGRSERVSQLMEEYPEAYRASPYDDQLVIEGNSSLGDEIVAYEDLFDYLIVPVGGGGLIAGISKALCQHGSETVLHGAEPLLGNDAARSVRERTLLKNETEPQTLADGARTLSLGKQNWEIIRDGVSEIHEITEEEIRNAVKMYFELANLKVEPTGALTLAAAIKNWQLYQGKKIAIVVSGGNVDPAVYADILLG